MNTLEQALAKLGVKSTIKELVTTPAHGLPWDARAWRVALTRRIGRGKEASEARLIIIAVLALEQTTNGEPTTYDVVQSLITDARAGDMTYWDFSQEHGGERSKEEVERTHDTCKKLGKRVKRFFGDTWENVLRAEQGEGPTVTKANGKARQSAARTA